MTTSPGVDAAVEGGGWAGGRGDRGGLVEKARERRKALGEPGHLQVAVTGVLIPISPFARFCLIVATVQIRMTSR